jgi:hypothetical protein
VSPLVTLREVCLRDNCMQAHIWKTQRLLSLIETGQIVAAFVVAIGVAGEFLGSYIARPIAHRVETKRELEMANLRAQAAAAELRAAELEAIIQPRYVTKAQEDAIATSMRPFAGHGMIIASHWIDAEAARLAGQIKTALNRAGIGIDDKHLNTMTVDKIGAYPEISTGTFGGGGGFARQNIHTGIEIWGSERIAVKRLADSLRSDGGLADVVTPESKEPFDNLYGPIPLIIFVGSKPVPESK